MSKKWTPPGNPWHAARGLVIIRNGMVYASVTNWWGVIVWGDNTGIAGLSGIVESTRQMTQAVRMMDGIGQGKRLKQWSEL
jgi:hypothetical protein